MEYLQPITIQVHLINGTTREFQQDNPEAIAAICNNLDGRVFTEANLIIAGKHEAIAFSGHALIGVSILTDQIPNSIKLREDLLKTVVTQISKESYLDLRNNNMPKVTGIRSNILSEIVFLNGQQLFLEFSEIAIGGLGERAEMHHLFTNPSLACHRLGGGFSLWNTAQMASWSHSPKLEAPDTAWNALEVLEPENITTKKYSLL